MRLPYIQVGQELLDHVANDMGLFLDVTEAEAGWMVLKLWEYGLSRGRPEAPPDGRIDGTKAAALVERRVGWKGEAGAFVEAATSMGLLERTEAGLRIRGMERYKRAWEKRTRPGPSKRSKESEVDIASGESPAEVRRQSAGQVPDKRRTSPSPSPSPSSLVSEEGVQGEEPPAPPPSVPIQVAEPKKPREQWTAEDFWQWAQWKRQQARLLPERRKPHPSKLSAWWSALHNAGGDADAACEAFFRFGDDPYWQSRTPPLPFAGFLQQWEQFLTLRGSHART